MCVMGAHQQKKGLLQTDRHCVRTQEICLEHPVRPIRPQMAPAQWLHPSLHQQKNLFHRTYRARVRTKPVRSLPPVLPDLLSPLCLSSLASGAPGRPTFPPKRPTPSLRPHPLPAPSCCIRPHIFSSTGLLPTLTNCAHPAALPDPLSPLAT